MNGSLPTPTVTGSSRAVPLTLIGVGGAGAKLVGRGHGQPDRWIRSVVDSDQGTLGSVSTAQRLAVGAGTTRGLGCGGDVAYARELAEAAVTEIQGTVSRGGLILLVAGAGGGVGAGMTPVVARCARAAGALVLALVVEPFDFEGRLRRKNADQALSALEGVCDVVLRVSNQAIARIEPPTASVPDLLAAADHYVLDIVQGLLGLVEGPSHLPVGFAELERWARARQGSGVVAHAAAEGAERAQSLWSQLAGHPLLDSGAQLREASGVLVRVSGGPDLRRDELELLQHEFENCCPQAQLL
ncbi:MAG TPA: hypothetical protein PLX89_24610, partial [Verrucomicrobiota bacterium]|nr:hypothetical protein [Verrucomicrobiota bacterium]